MRPLLVAGRKNMLWDDGEIVWDTFNFNYLILFSLLSAMSSLCIEWTNKMLVRKSVYVDSLIMSRLSRPRSFKYVNIYLLNLVRGELRCNFTFVPSYFFVYLNVLYGCYLLNGEIPVIKPHPFSIWDHFPVICYVISCTKQALENLCRWTRMACRSLPQDIASCVSQRAECQDIGGSRFKAFGHVVLRHLQEAWRLSWC